MISADPCSRESLASTHYHPSLDYWYATPIRLGKQGATGSQSTWTRMAVVVNIAARLVVYRNLNSKTDRSCRVWTFNAKQLQREISSYRNVDNILELNLCMLLFIYVNK